MNRIVLTLILVASSVACHRGASAHAEQGAELYAKYCATCHGAHGEGYAADNAPSLTTSTFRETVTDLFLRQAIERGRPGTAMAGYAQALGGPLAREQIDQLIAYLRRDRPPAPHPPPLPAGFALRGSGVYNSRCAICHGTPEARATAVHLANPAFLASASDAYLAAAIERGRPGTRMQAWENVLSPGEIADVVAYLRSLEHPVPPPVAIAPGTQGTLQPQPMNPALGAAPELKGPIVLNPKGKQADFKLKDDMYASVADVSKAYAEKRRLVIIDARTPSDYLRLHIDGAVSVPYYDMHELEKVPKDDTWVIAYCACPHHVSGTVVAELRKRGYKHTAVLDEGIFFWQQQGDPVVAAPGQLPVPAPPPLHPPIVRVPGTAAQK